jgi:hypothetical protein
VLTSQDFISIPYPPDLTRSGIAYACRSLAHTYDRMGGDDFNRLRRIVSGKAVELGFRRYLLSAKIPHDNLGITPFTDPDHYDIALGGRRCDIKSYQFIHKKRILQVRRNPELLLQASALVPADQMEADTFSDDDVLIFAFSNVLFASTSDEMQKAAAANQPLYLIYAMPSGWAQPGTWSSLGELALKCDTSAPLRVELGGQGFDRGFQTEEISLLPLSRTPLTSDFFSLAFIHPCGTPDGKVGIFSPVINQSVVVEPGQWGNIWVYGMEILLAGYITRREFRRRAGYLPAGSRVFQYPQTRTPNYEMRVKDLEPVAGLFKAVQDWVR